ncbi:MAG: leucyl aminopeptidase family protein [Oligoflexia bacterium]|nr:leucyl aminopeptidase family protein [Oligoflexia bacterium]
MNIELRVELFDFSRKSDLIVVSSFKKKSSTDLGHLNTFLKKPLSDIRIYKNFEADYNKSLYYPLDKNRLALMIGLGEKEKLTAEKLRHSFGLIFKTINDKIYNVIEIDLNSFNIFNDISKTTQIITETLNMAAYTFTKYQNQRPKTNKVNNKSKADSKTDAKANNEKKKIILIVKNAKEAHSATEGLERGNIISSGINFTRDLTNEVPNVMNSEYLAKVIVDDFKALTTKTKNKFAIRPASKLNAKLTFKTLTLKEIKKEKMNLLLAVNQGSAYEPRVIYLNYRPNKATKNTKHIALVGKGLTFDSGGYSLKPSSSIVGMKFDMAGAATVYGAFKNAIQLKSEYIISCFIGITDNLVSSNAFLPDSVIKGRSGKTVEIISTDAEGRLVLADILDYANNFKPNYIIDVATLTGACVRALGHVCGVMGNNEEFTKKILDAAKSQDERAWELPIFDEYRDDIKSTIADIRNTATSGNAGAQKAAAFLEHFIKDEMSWVHLDIAGIDNVGHLNYCPKGSASGLIVRTLTQFLLTKQS